MPITATSLSVSLTAAVVSFEIPPPGSAPAWPPVIVTPEIETVSSERLSRLKTPLVAEPWTVVVFEPAPTIATFPATTNGVPSAFA